MKLRIFAIFALVIGVVLLAVGAVAPMMAVENLAGAGGATAIIGGADKPTYRYVVFRLMDGWPAGVFLLGAALSLSALFCLVFTKTVKKQCRVETSLVALSLSAVGAAGLVCFLFWMATTAFGEREKNPIVYAYSIFLGAVCFFAFLGLCALYVVLRKKNSSILGVLLDVLTSILYLPGFFYALLYLSEVLH